MICCHVDDFVHKGDQRLEKLIEKLRERFSAGKIEEQTFKYIRFRIQQLSSEITLDHSNYINNMMNVALYPGTAVVKNEPLN